MDRCYVCLEEDGCLVYPCTCNLPVHRDCLKSLVEKTGQVKCTVCKHDYSDMDIKYKKRLIVKHMGLHVAFVCIIIFTLFGSILEFIVF